MAARGKVWWMLAGAANLAVGGSLLLRDLVKPPAPVALRVASASVTLPGSPRAAANTATNGAAAATALAARGSDVSRVALALSSGPVPMAEPSVATSVAVAGAVPVGGAVMPVPSSTEASLAPTSVSSERPRVTVKPRHVLLAPLAAWTKPGLCSTSEEAQATRDKLTESFRQVDAGEQGQFHFDPRLPEEASALVLGVLRTARAAAKQGLGLEPPPPQVFVYFDQQLMKAAACINEDVVAFYDGALHLVLGRPDLQQSVTHEYAHHALFSSGLIGPAWAQEGIAMNLAGETWWREPSRLQAMLQAPFSADQMDELIPYKLPAQQAVGFYVQAALSVQCLMRVRGWSLPQLTDSLRSASGADSVSYDLPELSQSSFLSSCVAQIASGQR